MITRRRIIGLRLRYGSSRTLKTLLFLAFVIIAASFIASKPHVAPYIDIARVMDELNIGTKSTTSFTFTLNLSLIGNDTDVIDNGDIITNDWESFANNTGVLNMSDDIEFDDFVKSVAYPPFLSPILTSEVTVDCHPDSGPTQQRCEMRKCLWTRWSSANALKCIINPTEQRYVLKSTDRTNSSTNYTLSVTRKSGFGKDSKNVRVSLSVVRSDVLRLHISDPNSTRFEAPVPFYFNQALGNFSNASISETSVLSLAAKDITVKFNLGQIIFTDILVQSVVCFSNESLIYGYDSNTSSLHIGSTWRYYYPYRSSSKQLSGDLHAFFLVMLPNGHSVGVYLHNSNFMRILSQPGPCLNFVTLGGLHDFYIIAMGKAPHDVTQAYWGLVGLVVLPPIGELSFTSDVDNMKIMNGRLDSSDISATYDILSETWQDALAVEVDVRIRDRYGQPLVCGLNESDANSTLADFSHMSTYKFWGTYLRLKCGPAMECFRQLMFLDIPRCFKMCRKYQIRLPIDIPGGLSDDDMLCVVGRLKRGVIHNALNAYSYLQARHTYYGYVDYLRRRPNLVSRATFPGQGNFSGHFELIDKLTPKTVDDAVVRLIAFNMYGIPLLGTNICGGVLENTDDHLCATLICISTWYPFMRQASFKNKHAFSNGSSSELSAAALKSSRKLRNELVLNLYSLMYYAATHAQLIVRPLFAEFPGDVNALKFVDTQFMWGSALMVAPFLSTSRIPGTRTLQRSVYLPGGVWYNWYSGRKLVSNGSSHEAVSVEYRSPLYCNGGSIVAVSTQHNETVPDNVQLGVVVCPDQNGQATGRLFRDDGRRVTSITESDYNVYYFSFKDNTLSVKCLACYYGTEDSLVFVKVLGLSKKVRAVMHVTQLQTHVERFSTLVTGFEYKIRQTFHIRLY